MKRVLLIALLLAVILLTPHATAEPSWTWTYSDACMVFSLSINDEGYTAAGFGYDVLLLSPNGSRVYKVPSRGFAYSIAISDNNYVVAGTKGFFVQLFSPRGKPLFEYKTGDQVWAVDISPDGETFVAGSNDGWLYLFKRGAGLVWKRNTGAPIWGTILDGGTIYFGNDAGLVGAYSISGKSLWNQSLGGRVWRISLSGNRLAVLVIHTDEAVTSNVYLLSTNGTIIWKKHFDGYVRDVDLDGNYLAVVGDIGEVDAFFLNGSPAYSLPFFSPLWHVAIRDGYLLAGGGGQEAIFISPNGELLWEFDDNRSISVVAMSGSGRFMAVADRTFETVNCQGTIYFIDRRPASTASSTSIPSTSSPPTTTSTVSSSQSGSPSVSPTSSTPSPATTASPPASPSSSSVPAGKGESGSSSSPWGYVSVIFALLLLIIAIVAWREMRE